MINLAQDEREKVIASIKVIGVGGGGGNTINSIIASGCNDIEFIATNTDAQALDLSKAHQRVQIGIKSTKGLGTGADPELGKRSAEEDLDKILESVGHADIVFLTAGLGGGTGSGALPVIARALKDKGVLSIAIVTKPFLFEGKRRSNVAEAALEQLKKEVDTLIVIPNQKLLEVVDQHVSMIDAFSMINDVLGQSVKGISDIITKPGHINVDFADVRTIMKDRGLAVMGTARASGERRAEEAALKAISSPLLENMDIEGARGVLLNITGGPSLGIHEISQAASVIYEQADQDASIIIGSVIDEELGDDISITLIATGFNTHDQKHMSIQESDDLLATAQPKQTATVELKQVTEKEQKAVPTAEPTPAPAPKPEPIKSAPETKEELLDVSALDIPAFMRQNTDHQNDN